MPPSPRPLSLSLPLPSLGRSVGLLLKSHSSLVSAAPQETNVQRWASPPRGRTRPRRLRRRHRRQRAGMAGRPGSACAPSLKKGFSAAPPLVGRPSNYYCHEEISPPRIVCANFIVSERRLTPLTFCLWTLKCDKEMSVSVTIKEICRKLLLTVSLFTAVFQRNVDHHLIRSGTNTC